MNDKNKNKTGYKKTSVGWIPEEWEVKRLENIAMFISGGTPSTAVPEYFEGDIPWITSGDLNKNYIRDVKGRISKKGLENSSAKMIEVDTLLIALYGATAGVTAISQISAAINQAILAITPHSDETRFLYFKLNHLKYWLITTYTQGGQPNLSGEIVKSIEISLPPIPEQRKIADILTIWDESLEKLNALIDAKERFKQALMQQLLTGELRFSSDKSPWEKVRMGELLNRVFRPIEWTAEMQLSLVSLRRRCGGLFRRPNALGADYKTQDLHELKFNDFLVSKRQVAHGAWALVPLDFKGSHVSKEYAIFVNKSPDKLHMPFFAWLAQTTRMIRLARVASTGVHIEKLIFDPNVFLRESIRIPPTVTEQKQIANVLDVAQSELVLLRAKREALEQQKKGMMQKLLTGEKRVKINY